MIGTALCIYETPCGWCAKWDKKCDKKITENIEVEKPRVVIRPTEEMEPDWFTGGDRGDILG